MLYAICVADLVPFFFYNMFFSKSNKRKLFSIFKQVQHYIHGISSFLKCAI